MQDTQCKAAPLGGTPTPRTPPSRALGLCRTPGARPLPTLRPLVPRSSTPLASPPHPTPGNQVRVVARATCVSSHEQFPPGFESRLPL
jgi:hypothetical protein